MFERLLEPGSTAVPPCPSCRGDMRHERTELRSSDAAVKIFCCDDCSREMRLMVWTENEVLPAPFAGHPSAEASQPRFSL